MKVIAFYSYKGGSGRTVVTANLVPLLVKELGATKENPILVIDMDMDSAGLTHVFKQYHRFEESNWVTSNLLKKDIGNEILLGHKDTKKIFFNKDDTQKLSADIIEKLKDTGLKDNSLKLLSEIELRESIIEGFKKKIHEDINLLRIKLNDAKTKDEMIEFIEKNLPAFGMVEIPPEILGKDIPRGSVRFIGSKQVSKDSIIEGDGIGKLEDLYLHCERENYSAMIIDSASGRQPSANIVHNISTDKVIIYCLRLSEQFREGTNLQLEYFINSEKGVEGITDIIILPVAIPKSDYKDETLRKFKENALHYLRSKFNELFKKAENKEKQVNILNDFIENGIPEVESFKWHERILYNIKDLQEDENKALEVFKQLAKKIKDVTIKHNKD